MMRAAAVIPGLLVCAVLLAWPARAEVPVIEAGREAEIEALFSGVGTGSLSGWEVGDIRIEMDLIVAGFNRGQGGGVELRFVYPAPDSAAAARTSAFDVFIHSRSEIDEAQARQFARALAADLEARVDLSFWRKWKETVESMREQKSSGLGYWYLCRGGLATLAWLTGLLALGVLLGIAVVRERPWLSAEGRRALIEISVVFILAFLVRWLLVPAGPGNFHHHPPDPHHPSCVVGFLGPGQDAWTLLWAWLFGAGDGVLFFSSAFCAAATAPAAYLLVWGGTKKRRWGLAASAALALWPAHALLSPTDDAYGLAISLFLTGMALVVVSESRQSKILLVAGWLAACLAAAVRPDFAVMLLFLAAQVLWQPGTRQMQFEIWPALAVGLLGVATLVSFLLVMERMVGFVLPFGFSNLASLGCLVGLHPASMLRPPWTLWPLTVIAVLGLLPALKATRFKAALWLGASLVSPFIFYDALRGDFVSARYQMFVTAATAMSAGIALAWLWERATARRAILAAAAAVLALATVIWSLAAPPPEPVFRMEYRFIRKHIASISGDCRIMWIDWRNDLGLYPPIYLSGRLGLGHQWIKAAENVDVESGCVVYWRPGMCGTLEARWEELHPENYCQRIPRAYRLDPIAETQLPAQAGHAENYPSGDVTVGFYRLRKLK